MGNIKCPFCHTSSSMSSLFLLPISQLNSKCTLYFRGEEYVSDELIEESKIWTSETEIELRGSLNDLWKCDTCERIIHVIISRDEINARFNIIVEGEYFHDRSVFHVKTIEKFDPDRWDSAIPTQIRIDLAQAQTAFFINLFTAALLLVRRALERTAMDFEVTGKNLAEKIRILLKNEGRLLELADNIRLLGNIAAHGEEMDEEPTKEDVEDILDFSNHFMDAIYVMPTRIKKLQDRRSSNTNTRPVRQIGSKN